MLYLEVLFWWAEANRPNSNEMFEGQSSQNTENPSSHIHVQKSENKEMYKQKKIFKNVGSISTVLYVMVRIRSVVLNGMEWRKVLTVVLFK